MVQNKKPPLTFSKAIPAIAGIVLTVFGAISPFLSFSKELQIPIDNWIQLILLICVIAACATIAYLVKESSKMQISWVWWAFLLVACAALALTIIFQFSGFQVEYRFRDCEYTDALTDQLEGWTMDRKEEIPTGDILYLDDWSDEKPREGNFDQKEQWRFRTKQTTQSSTAPDSSWTLDSGVTPVTTTSEWYDYPVSGQSVETAVQYRHREVRPTSERNFRTLGWTTEEPGEVSQHYNVQGWEEREASWHYFQYYCLFCGNVQMEHGTCLNCGDFVHYYDRWEPIPYEELHTNLSGWVRLELDNDIYYANTIPGNDGYIEPQKEYLYTIVEDTPLEVYGEWSEWSFENPGDPGPFLNVEGRTVYRTSETIYTYFRWSGWSDWGSSPVAENDSTQVDYRILYRPYEEKTQTVYYFIRWNEWSEWSTQKPEKKENREIQSQIARAESDKQAAG